MAEGELQSVCDWCMKDNKKVLASLYCYECMERFCRECSVWHSRGRFQANHTLIDIEGKNLNTKDIEFMQKIQTCPNHPKECVQYICKDHDEALCNDCERKSHRMKCKQVVPVSEECGNRTTEPCSTTLNTLNELVDVTDTLMKHEDKNEHLITKSKKRVLKELQSVKKEFDNAFQTLKQQIESNVDNRCERLLNEILTSRGDIEKVHNKMTSDISDAEMIVDLRDPVLCYLFDHQQRKANTISSFRDKVSELKGKVQARDIKLVEQTPIRTLCEQITKCLKVEVEVSMPDLPFGESLASEVIQEDGGPGKPLKNVRLEYESNTNCVICSCVWIKEYIILANSTKNELIQFDANEKAVVSTFKCPSYPTSIAAIDDTRMAVCYDQEVIDILLMQQQKLVRQQRLNASFNVLAASVDRGKNQLVCLSASGRVGFLSLNDETFSIVPNEGARSEITEGCACDIEYDNQTGNIYVACHLKNKVVSFDSRGKDVRQIAPSNPDNKMSPLSVTVDSDSYLYIVSEDVHNILQYDRNLNFIRKLVPENTSVGDPCCIAFNNNMTKFVVAGRGAEKELRVFCFC